VTRNSVVYFEKDERIGNEYPYDEEQFMTNDLMKKVNVKIRKNSRFTILNCLTNFQIVHVQ